MAWYTLRDERKEPTTKNTLPSKTLLQVWWRNQKLSRQAKVKRIQHHKTSFITNAKGTSLGKKYKRRKIPTENTPKTIKKTVIGSYLSIIILNVNESNVPTKDTDWLDGWKHVHVCTSTYHITVLDLPKLHATILY